MKWINCQTCLSWLKLHDEDVHDLRSIENEFPAIAFNDSLKSSETLSFKPTTILLSHLSIKEGKYSDILSTMSTADIDAVVNAIETIGKKFQDEINKVAGTQLRSSPMMSNFSPLVSPSITISVPHKLNSIDVAATFRVPLTIVGDLHKLLMILKLFDSRASLERAGDGPMFETRKSQIISRKRRWITILLKEEVDLTSDMG
ncbi:hypothetical protein Tco_1058465 [Tanacetum coccineum]|uniref:Uncharacterized protein n=1 Tax=Tanacetum coccineum TaxID=301880 RepID=A0ABQ5H8D0_9ASTR